MIKQVILTGLIFGLFSIILGAFGAHALKKHLTPDQIISFETGVKYLMYHAFFLLFLGLLKPFSFSDLKLIYGLIVIGIIFFSGSIFLLTTETITGFSIKKFAFITPIGGFLLLLGWLFTFLKVLKTTL